MSFRCPECKSKNLMLILAKDNPHDIVCSDCLYQEALENFDINEEDLKLKEVNSFLSAIRRSYIY